MAPPMASGAIGRPLSEDEWTLAAFSISGASTTAFAGGSGAKVIGVRVEPGVFWR